MTDTPTLHWPEDDAEPLPIDEAELQRELDELTAEPSQAETVAEALVKEATILDELEGLVQESVKIAAQLKEAKDARTRISRGHARQGDVETVKAWQNAYEWRAVATAGVFQRFKCACGNAQTIFDGLMRHEHHARVANTSRWIQTDRILPGLPVETVVREKEVTMCGACAGRHGSWTLDAPTLWKD